MFTHRKVQLTTLAMIVWFVSASPPGYAAAIGGPEIRELAARVSGPQ